MRLSALLVLPSFAASLLGQAPGAILEVGGDARVTRLVACWLPDKAPVTPFVAARAPITFRGKIDIALRDRFVFSVEGNGTYELRIGGEPIELGKPARLAKGKLDFVAVWTPPTQGDASTRLFWECGEWSREPVPPKFLSHAPDDPVLTKATELRRGRELVAALKCTKCHAPSVPLDATTAMPELAYEAPSLLDIGTRLEPGWIARWLEDPKALRPSARMPKLLGKANAARDARDIAAFLVAFGKKPEIAAPPAPVPEQVASGGKLFAGLGCIGCHTKPDDRTVPQDGRIPLRSSGNKFRGDALASFLRAPTSAHAYTRMPTFGLSEPEARDLSAYLRATGEPAWTLGDAPTDAQHGRELVQELGCARCHADTAHAQKPVPDLEKASALAAAGKSCSLAEYGLDASEQKAIAAILATDRTSFARDSLAEHAERQFQELRCSACHTRDRQQDLWSQLGGEIAALAPQGTETSVGAARPHLTWAGEKLRPEHVTKLLDGSLASRTRPWLTARMPAWPMRATTIAEGLALGHGCSPSTGAGAAIDPAKAELGKKLVGADGGFTCIQCHAIGTQKATQVFESEGVNFSLAKDRLRQEYFERWLWNPLRIDAATKMPRYVDKSGKTQIGDGDAKAQIQAMWHFMLGL